MKRKKTKYVLFLVILVGVTLYLTNEFNSTVSYEEVDIVSKTENSIIIKNNVGIETEVFAEKPTIQLINEGKRYMVRYESTLFTKSHLKSIEHVE